MNMMPSFLQRFGLYGPLFKGILLILFACPSILANPHSVSTYPEPQSVNHWHCRIENPGRICDVDSMLTKEERNELMDLVEEFTELTKMAGSNGIEDCARKGIKLGIALAHSGITENEDNLDPNQNYQTYLDGISRYYDPPTDIRNIFDYIWGRINKLQGESRDNDMVAALLAEKWHLLEEEGTTPNGCNRTMFIVMTADPPDVHIWSHPSVPISTSEKEAIIANNANLIANGEYANALKAIIANLRWLILHRQAELFGQNEGFPSFPPQYVIYIFWFGLSLSCLFSLVALILAVFVFLKSSDVYPLNNRIQIRMKNLIEKEEEEKEEENNGINHNPA